MTENAKKSYTCIIIDDEYPARMVLSAHIANYAQLKLCGQAHNAFDGLKLVEQIKPDVIFLNVSMPHMTGIEMLDHFNTQDHYIILTTALEEGTVLDPRVKDYLRVLVTTDQFAVAMERLEMSGI